MSEALICATCLAGTDVTALKKERQQQAESALKSKNANEVQTCVSGGSVGRGLRVLTQVSSPSFLILTLCTQTYIFLERNGEAKSRIEQRQKEI